VGIKGAELINRPTLPSEEPEFYDDYDEE